MYKLTSILIVLVILVSCSTPKDEENTNNKAEKEYKAEEKKQQVEGDIPEPTPEPEIEVIKTADKADNSVLFSKFLADLSSETFQIETTELNTKKSYKDCDRNVFLNMEGQGIRKYYVKRQEEKPKNYYPDFIVWVYEFENEGKAINVEKRILAALMSKGRLCEGKDPTNIVRNKNEVFQLQTRAEMFRGYINDFGEKLKNYSSE